MRRAKAVLTFLTGHLGSTNAAGPVSAEIVYMTSNNALPDGNSMEDRQWGQARHQ